MNKVTQIKGTRGSKAKFEFSFIDACEEPSFICEERNNHGGLWIGDIRDKATVITRENASEIWPLIKRFAETGTIKVQKKQEPQ